MTAEGRRRQAAEAAGPASVMSAGVAAVARQEFRLRIRAGRWQLVLASWCGALLAFTLLLADAVGAVAGDELPFRGTVVHGSLALLVLGLALLVVPALAAQSVNGDRERGTLAVLQVTRLRPVEIVLGKFVAAWGTSLVFLALSLPLVAFAMVLGGVPLRRVLALTVVLALLLGSVVAVSLWLSAALARTTTSAVLAYLAVFGLSAGTPVLFGLATALSTETVPRRSVGCTPAELAAGCTPTEVGPRTRARPDRTWWLLAPNPFVVLADAAPQLPAGPDPEAATLARGLDPLGQLGRAARGLRDDPDVPGQQGGPVWPLGVALHVLAGAAALALAVRRLRTPTRRLPPGQRIA